MKSPQLIFLIVKNKSFSSNFRNKARMPTLDFLFSIVLLYKPKQLCKNKKKKSMLYITLMSSQNTY